MRKFCIGWKSCFILVAKFETLSLRSMTLQIQWKLNAPKSQFSSPMCLFFNLLSIYSLEALETFIRVQRALLERTQTDIARLQKLRSDVVAQPAAFVSDLSNQVNFYVLSCFIVQRFILVEY